MISLIDGYKNSTGAGTSPWKLTVVFCVSPLGSDKIILSSVLVDKIKRINF